MIKIVTFVLLILTFSSCSINKPSVVKANQKSFAQEDTYILFALRAEQIKDNRSASKLFKTLYEKSKKKEYLYRSVENDLIAKQYDKVIKRVNALSQDAVFDAPLTRLKVIALFEQNRLDEAISLSTKLAAKTKMPNDYLLTSDIYSKRQQFDLAVRYLESAYAKEHNEKILDKMSIILYVNLGKKKEAIAHLETHSRMLGCSEVVCHRLAAFYSNDNNLEGLLSVYLRLYEYKKSDDVAKKIIQIYTYKHDYMHLTEFLEKSNADDALLLQLYMSSKKYKKAYHLADTLYEQTGDINYLGQSAIYEYEGSGAKVSKETLSSVIHKLEDVIKHEKNATYINYLGYILIDHEIDVKKGMKYIDEVLELKPNSAYYLDSRAWGYYKLGQCKKAQKVINKVLMLEGGDDPEVLVHKKAIERCIKTQKGKKRK